eukprot:1389487-Pyramimonas_sp.AAC.1
MPCVEKVGGRHAAGPLGSRRAARTSSCTLADYLLASGGAAAAARLAHATPRALIFGPSRERSARPS